MFEALRARALHVLRVPPDPHPPTGAPGSVRVFRAGRNLYKLRLLRWALAQAGAIAGIVASLIFIDRLESAFGPSPAARPPVAVAAAQNPPTGATPTLETPASPPQAEATPKKAPTAKQGRARPPRRWPGWIFPVLRFFEWVGIALFIVQIPLTYALVRLDFELRWYIVTDRSLRIRSGLTTVQESTMSFANVQQVLVTQGPLQRYLGLADVRVQSAGGGGDHHDQKGGDSLHTGVFHGVDNGAEIRDLVLARLRAYRETGLGDPDEIQAAQRASAAELNATATHTPRAALAAAQELLEEARALRAGVS